VLGVDLPDTAPRVALALRQSVRQAAFAAAARQNVPGWQDAAVRELGREARSPLFILSADATRLDDAGTALRAAPPDIARLGAAVLHALDPSAARVDELAHDTRVEQIAQALRGAARPLIVSGVGAQHEALLPLAAAIAGALTRLGRAAQLLLTVPECNSLGLALLGALPLSGALDALRSAGAHTLLVLENDLYRRAARAAVDAALQGTRHLVVLDHTPHATVERAELVLPAATFAESSGTLVNYEARAQRFFQLLFPEDEVRASWRWLDELRCSLHPDAAPRATLDEQIAVIASELPVLAAVRAAAPSAELRIAGSRIASAPHRESGRTAMYADRSVHEPAPPPYPDGPYSNSMEGYYGTMPAALYPYFWAPAWNSEQGLNKFQQEVGGPLRGGPAGVRLFGGETARATRQPAPMIPPAFAPRAAEWLLVASPRVFGSEELSAHAPAVGERLSPAALELNPQDAMLLGVQQGEQIELQAQDMKQRLTVQLHPALVSGVAGVSVGLPGEPYLSFPAWGRLRKPNP